MAALETFRNELVAEHTRLVPVIEGLQDYNRLNLSQAVAPVQQAIADYSRRQSLIEATIAALNNLAADGYPDLPVRNLPPEAYAELRENLHTINLAIAQFGAAEEATVATIVAGEPRPKE